MRVLSVPCLKDNYSYLVIDGTYATVVDPSEHTPVRTVIEREGLILRGIWLTHHHWDHVGGLEGLASPEIEIVAHSSDRERVPRATRFVEDGDVVTLGSLHARIIHNPGHTRGAISYVVNDAAVFTGDTLFGAGCGRVFEGTMEMMHASLQRLAALPGDMRVYFGHEYTASNLKFAAHVEPTNAAIAPRARSLIGKASCKGMV